LSIHTGGFDLVPGAVVERDIFTEVVDHFGTLELFKSEKDLRELFLEFRIDKGNSLAIERKSAYVLHVFSGNFRVVKEVDEGVGKGGVLCMAWDDKLIAADTCMMSML
jgi:hypothetical protein